MNNVNILVSGVAGDIGFGVGRILRSMNVVERLHGIDIHDRHPGLAVFDQCAIAPRASDEHYLDWLAAYLREQCIEVFIPTSEAEISCLSAQGLRELAGAKILITSELAVRHSLDKALCMQFLAGKGVRVPANGLVGQQAPKHFPVIVKPRSGQGSKGLQKIERPQDLADCAGTESVWQELLLPDDEEFTCAVYRSPRAECRTLLIRRQLQGGFTSRGEVVEHPEMEAYVTRIAQVLEVEGVINVQLRLTDTGPVLFEINPRLSSTLVFRDKLGFTDLRWWLAETMGCELAEYISPVAGTVFYRGVQEYFIKPFEES